MNSFVEILAASFILLSSVFSVHGIFHQALETTARFDRRVLLLGELRSEMEKIIKVPYAEMAGHHGRILAGGKGKIQLVKLSEDIILVKLEASDFSCELVTLRGNLP